MATFAPHVATAQLRRGMPEQLRKSIDDEHAKATAAWDPKDPDLPSSIGLMLAYIGSILAPPLGGIVNSRPDGQRFTLDRGSTLACNRGLGFGFRVWV